MPLKMYANVARTMQKVRDQILLVYEIFANPYSAIPYDHIGLNNIYTSIYLVWF